jgi:hypothetical protein
MWSKTEHTSHDVLSAPEPEKVDRKYLFQCIQDGKEDACVQDERDDEPDRAGYPCRIRDIGGARIRNKDCTEYTGKKYNPLFYS